MMTYKYIFDNERRNQNIIPASISLIIAIAFSCVIVTGLYIRPIMYLTIVILLVYLLIIPLENGIELMFFLMSFENIFKLSYSSSSIFTYLQIVLIIRIILGEEKLRIENKSIGVLGGFVLYITLFSYNGVLPLLRIVLGITLLICVSQSGLSERVNCKRLLFFYSIGILTSGLIAILNLEEITPYVSNLIVRLNDGTAINRFSGLYQNANYYSIELSLAIAGNIVMYMHNEENELELVGLGLPLIWFGIMTQSKTFVLTLVVMAAVFIIYSGSRRQSALIMIIIVALFIFLCFRSQALNFIEKYFFRVLSLKGEYSTLTDITTGRNEIWKSYIDAIIENPHILLFGKGLESSLTKHGAHNMFIELFYCLGILGTALYFCTIYVAGKRMTVRRQYALFLIVFVLRASAANIAFYNNLYYYYILLFTLMYSRINSNDTLIHKRNNHYSKSRYIIVN